MHVRDAIGQVTQLNDIARMVDGNAGGGREREGGPIPRLLRVVVSEMVGIDQDTVTAFDMCATPLRWPRSTWAR